MASTTPFGLRRTVDLDAEFSEYVVDSVALVNEVLGEDDMGFIFDTVDVRQQVVAGKHLWDMFGWTGERVAAAAALSAWDSGDDSLLDNLNYVFVGFDERADAPVVNIDGEGL